MSVSVDHIGINVTDLDGNVLPHGHMLFANIMGASPCTDSLQDAYAVPCEFDAPTLMLVLARLDSLTGGAVWCGKKPYGITAAVTVEGAFSRCRRDTSPGSTLPPPLFQSANAAGTLSQLPALTCFSTLLPPNPPRPTL